MFAFLGVPDLPGEGALEEVRRGGSLSAVVFPGGLFAYLSEEGGEVAIAGPGGVEPRGRGSRYVRRPFRVGRKA